MVASLLETDETLRRYTSARSVMDEFEHHGVRYGKVLARYLIICLTERHNVAKYLAATLRNLVQLTKIPEQTLKSGTVLASFFSLNRKDHTELFGKALSAFKPQELSLLMADNTKTRYLKPELRIFRILSRKRAGEIVRRSNVGGPFVRLFLWSCLYRFIREQERLERLVGLRGYKAYVAYSDTLPLENILVQLMQQRRVPTLGFQHGVYWFDRTSVKSQQGILILFTNLTADKTLAWGKLTVDELGKTGYPKSRFVLVGNPRFDRYRSRKAPKSGRFAVLLDQRLFRRSNRKLLRIADAFADRAGLTYVVKLHPDDTARGYAAGKRCADLGVAADLSSADFIIVHTSTTYLEMLMGGRLVFRYHGDPPNLDIPGAHDTFSTAEELLRLHKRDPARLKTEYKKYAKYYFSNLGKDIPAAYRKAILASRNIYLHRASRKSR